MHVKGWILWAAMGAAALLTAGCSDTPAGAASPPADAVRGAPLIQVGAAKPKADTTVAATDTPAPASEIPGAPDVASLTKPTNAPATRTPAAVEVPSRAGYKSVTFDQLASFRFPTFLPREGEPVADPNGAVSTEIPPEIEALNGQKISVAGFMVPIEIRNGRVHAFLLVRNQLACCFGMPMGLTEWLDVSVAGTGGLDSIQDVLIAVSGTLEIGAKVSDDGLVLSLYRMKADSLRPLDGF